MTEQIDPRRHRFVDDPYRPLYHFLAPAEMLKDPNGTIFWKGKYHLFYQHNPHGAFDNVTTMHWGHAVSDDLVHWKDLPIALTPTPDGPDRSGCWSGGAFDNDGVPTILYYGHPEGNSIATSDDDLIVWEKHPGNPVIPHPPKGQTQWRPFDPCIWKEGDTFYSLAGGSIKDIGDTAFLFRSRDAINWQYMHPLYVAELNDEPESDCAVPDFFPLGDRHVLLFASHQRGAQYYIGTYENHRFHPERHGRMNFGEFTLECGNILAPISLLDGRDRRICFGWIGEGRAEQVQKDSGWSGIISLPRVLSLSAEHTLCIEPIAELESLRRGHAHLAGVHVIPASPVSLQDVEGDCLEIGLQLDHDDVGTFEIAVRCSPDDSERTTIFYDRRDGCLVLDVADSSLSPDAVGRDVQRGPMDLAPGEPLDLRIFLDRSVVEVFANARLCLTKRIYPSRPDSLGVRLLARGGPTTVRSIDVWKMAPVWPHAGS